MRLGGQVRIAGGFGTSFLGWDMTAALGLADALGMSRMAVAIFLPEIEQVAMAKINEQIRQSRDEP